MKFLEYIINRLVEFRNNRARSKASDGLPDFRTYIDWTIHKQKARKLTQEEIDLFI